MRLLVLFVFISLFCHSLSKNVKTLSDSMGQEVIEIAGPKELPPGLDEEPSGDMEDEDDLKPTPDSATKKDKKSATSPDARKKLKDVEKIDGVSAEDEEARLEKELAEIYKDTDYKDSGEDTSEPKETTAATEMSTNATVTDTSKPIGRQRNNFKFAPDSTNKKDVEKFRTSVDDISCKSRQKLSGVQQHLTKPVKDSLTDSATRVLATSCLHLSLVIMMRIYI